MYIFNSYNAFHQLIWPKVTIDLWVFIEFVFPPVKLLNQMEPNFADVILMEKEIQIYTDGV